MIRQQRFSSVFVSIENRVKNIKKKNFYKDTTDHCCVGARIKTILALFKLSFNNQNIFLCWFFYMTRQIVIVNKIGPFVGIPIASELI